jgi:replicative DNA helicase
MSDYRTRAELDAVMPDGQQRPVLNLTPRIEQRAVEELPGADEMADAQWQSAVSRLHEDTRSYPKMPWESLADLVGPMCPEDLVMIAARTGGGKSLFLQNLFNAMIEQGRFGTYIGLEQSADILRIKWACLRTDVPPKLVLATRDDEYDTPEWRAAMAIVQEDLRWQRSAEIKVRAHFAATRMINARKLAAWTEWAVDHGAEFVIVDHIDRIQHGDGKNSFHEMSQTVRLAKELAAKHRIVMLVASQVGRPGDPLERFMPPSLHQMRGGGTKEEEADTVLGIYRPLRATVNDAELKAVRQGLRDSETVIEPNIMGVMLLKHRLDGPVAGKMVKLAVKHQRVLDLPERDRWTTQYPPRQIV